MEFSLFVGVIWFLANLFVCLGNRCVEKWEFENGFLPPRGSIIEGTECQEFIYCDDLHCMKAGDYVGLGLTWAVFGQLVASMGIVQWGLFVIVVIGGVLFFRRDLLRPNHKPDSAAPQIGVVSWTGAYHTAYFGLSLGANVLCLYWALSNWSMDTPTLVWIIGGLLWVLAWITDLENGRFEPVKWIVYR